MNTIRKDDPSPLFDGLLFEKINPLIEKAISFFFRKIDFDTESLLTLKKHSDGNVVYASFHTSNLSLLLLHSLLKRHGLKTPKFALEYNPFMLQPFNYILKRIFRPIDDLFSRHKRNDVIDSGYIERLLQAKESILFSLISKRYFLKRYTETRYDSLVFLVKLQQKQEEPILLLPQIIFWNMNPERTDTLISSSPTGNRGFISGWLTTTKSITPSFVRISSPINLKEEIEKASSGDPQFIATGLRNRLLEVYHHEKRSVLGPVIKRREVLMEKVLYHKNILSEIDRLVKEKRIPEKKLKKKAFKYYREISADFHIYMIRFLDKVLSYVFNKIYDGIHYDPESIRMIREASQKGPLVITPCHKSHMDYLIMSYVFYHNKLIPPHIAAGVNLSFFPMGYIFRTAGAFFLRRSFKGLDLYPQIFKQYVKTLIYEGYPIEFFIEGGRTRTGKVALPKYGFLNYLIEAIEEGYNKDLVFVPVSINYDRILEESSYVQELKGKEKEKESVMAILESRKLLKRKYGKVYISIHTPFTLKEVEAEGTGSHTIAEEVSIRIVRKINEVTMVTPYSLTSAAILLLGIKGFPKKLILERMNLLYDFLAYINVRMSDSLQRRANLVEIMESVIDTFLKDGILEHLKFEEGSGTAEDEFYIIKEENRPRIMFYKNSILHYFLPLAMQALSHIRLAAKGALSEKEAEEEYRFIRDLFELEFIYPAENDEVERERSRLMREYIVSESFVQDAGSSRTVSERGSEAFHFFAGILKDYLESYLVVTQAALAIGKSRLNRKDLVTEVRKTGIKMYHTGEITLAESLSLPNYNNALALLEARGILTRRDSGKKYPDMEITDRKELEALNASLKEYLAAI